MVAHNLQRDTGMQLFIGRKLAAAALVVIVLALVAFLIGGEREMQLTLIAEGMLFGIGGLYRIDHKDNMLDEETALGSVILVAFFWILIPIDIVVWIVKTGYHICHETSWQTAKLMGQ
jgi:hypothetical protein